MNIATKLRVGDVVRFHIVRTARQQTLAEHHHRLWLIVCELIKRLQLAGYCAGAEEYALTHDMAEILTGDLPTPFKRALERFAASPTLFADLEKRYYDESTYHIIAQTPAWYVCKIADCIEGWHFLTVEGLGRHAADVRQQLEFRARKYAGEAARHFAENGSGDVAIAPWQAVTQTLMSDIVNLPVEHAT